VDTDILYKDPRDVAQALDFADEALMAFRPKIMEQHETEIRKLSERLGLSAKAGTPVVHPGGLRTDIVFSEDTRVVFHTRYEVRTDSVRFVTGAKLQIEGEAFDMLLKDFHVQRG